jgi:hypothetical protein
MEWHHFNLKHHGGLQCAAVSFLVKDYYRSRNPVVRVKRKFCTELLHIKDQQKYILVFS